MRSGANFFGIKISIAADNINRDHIRIGVTGKEKGSLVFGIGKRNGLMGNGKGGSDLVVD